MKFKKLILLPYCAVSAYVGFFLLIFICLIHKSPEKLLPNVPLNGPYVWSSILLLFAAGLDWISCFFVKIHFSITYLPRWGCQSASLGQRTCGWLLRQCDVSVHAASPLLHFPANRIQ
jgi:hypothetical protein